MSETYWNQNRQRIYDWMIANDLQSYAQLYKGSVAILYERKPGYLRFVSHGVRDIANGMAKRKLGLARPQVQYRQLVQAVLSSWLKGNLPMGQETFAAGDVAAKLAASAVNVPAETIRRIQELLREHETGCRRSDDLPSLFFQAFLPNQSKHYVLPKPYPDLWKQLKRWFEKHCHENGDRPDAEVEREIESKFVQFEEILLSVADRYTRTIQKLDEILEDANS